jgi:hypothetical protein
MGTQDVQQVGAAHDEEPAKKVLPSTETARCTIVPISGNDFPPALCQSFGTASNLIGAL